MVQSRMTPEQLEQALFKVLTFSDSDKNLAHNGEQNGKAKLQKAVQKLLRTKTGETLIRQIVTAPKMTKPLLFLNTTPTQPADNVFTLEKRQLENRKAVYALLKKIKEYQRETVRNQKKKAAQIKPLFWDQTTHLLSDTEQRLFFKKLGATNRYFSMDDKNQMQRALSHAIQTPTGAQQARRILTLTDDDVNTLTDKIADAHLLHTRSCNKPTIQTYVDSLIYSDLSDNPLQMGTALLHEMRYTLQRFIETDNRLLTDAETIAFSRQLAAEQYMETEIESDYFDAAYTKRLQENYHLFLEHINHSEFLKTLPSGMLAFVPEQTANTTKAAEAWAWEYAALKTQAQAIHTLLTPVEKWTPREHIFSYNLLTIQHAYLTNGLAGRCDTVTTTMHTRNPFIQPIHPTDIPTGQKLTRPKKEMAALDEEMAAVQECDALMRTIQTVRDIIQELQPNNPVRQALAEKNGILSKVENRDRLTKEEEIILRHVLLPRFVRTPVNLLIEKARAIEAYDKIWAGHPTLVHKQMATEIAELTGNKNFITHG